MPLPRILVIGAQGQVGWELQRALAPLGEVIATQRSRGSHRIDLARPETLIHGIRAIHPDLIVNAAAYTAVDKAEEETDLAYQINAAALHTIGQVATEIGAPVIHYSTDFVFSGESARPYREDDATGPLGTYGASKLKGEKNLLDSCKDSLVLRTSWVYGVRGHNFMLTMLKLFSERSHLSVVKDQIGAPTWCRQIAGATALLVPQILHASTASPFGVYHLSAAGETSWHGFACAIREMSELQCDIQAISSEQYPLPAKRPAYSVLDNGRLTERFGIQLPHWRQSLEQCFADWRGKD